MSNRPVRTLLELRIRERCMTLEEFVEVAERFARDHQESGTLSLRHLQRLIAGQQVPGALRPATARLLERIFGESVAGLLGSPIGSSELHPPAATTNGAARLPSLSFPDTQFADADYLEAVRQHIWHIVELDNRFGGTDLAGLTVRFFRAVHNRLGTGAYEPAIERDLQAVVGELAEVAGWLCYDADRQDDVRRMNHEALYFSRLAGDRQMELLTIQNSSMHAGFMGRHREALHLAESVLESRDRLSPRVKTLFLMRKARALAQGGDGQALRLFAAVRSHYQDGVRDSDPKWVWWVDERELAWHEGMAQLHLGKPTLAVEQFERSVAATAPHQVRSRYLHLAYLLAVQTHVDAWSDADATLGLLVPLVDEVASRRTVALLTRSLPKLREPQVPTSTRSAAEHLQLVLAQAAS